MKRLTIGIQGSPPLDVTASQLGEAMGFAPEERDSVHFGGTYYLGRTEAGEEVTVFANHDPIDDAPAYPDHADLGVVVRIHRTELSPDEATALLDETLRMRSRVLFVEPLRD